MKRTILPVILSSLLLGVLFDFCIYSSRVNIPSVSLLLYLTTVFGATLLLSHYYKRYVSVTVLCLMGLVLFLAGMLIIRASNLLILNILFILYCLLLIAELARQPKISLIRYTSVQYTGKVLTLPFMVMGQSLKLAGRGFSIPEDRLRQKQHIRPIARGVLLSLPILFVFLLLFSSADLVFSNLLSSIIDVNVSGEFVFRSLEIGFISVIFIGIYTLLFTESTNTQDETPARSLFKLGAVEAMVMMSLVASLFLLFVLIQFAYLFGVKDHVQVADVTYAEYARKGFFELIFISLITLALIAKLRVSTVWHQTTHMRWFKYLSTVLIAETLIIVLSAHKRLGLYEETYGFTILRLLAHMIIIWLAVIFGLFAYSIWREKSREYFAFQVFLSLVAFMLVINIMNPDALIARKNIDHFYQTNKLDLSYLFTLSSDATPVTMQLLNDKNEQIQKTVAGSLYFQKEGLNTSANDWRSFNLSRAEARDLLNQRADELNAQKNHGAELQQTDL